MTPTLIFATAGLGREIIKLGDVAIGQLVSHAAGGNRASFLLNLPDTLPRVRHAYSFKIARKIIREEVSEWFLRAGVFYPEQLIDCTRFNGASEPLHGDDAVAAE